MAAGGRKATKAELSLLAEAHEQVTGGLQEHWKPEQLAVFDPLEGMEGHQSIAGKSIRELEADQDDHEMILGFGASAAGRLQALGLTEDRGFSNRPMVKPGARRKRSSGDGDDDDDDDQLPHGTAATTGEVRAQITGDHLSLTASGTQAHGAAKGDTVEFGQQIAAQQTAGSVNKRSKPGLEPGRAPLSGADAALDDDLALLLPDDPWLQVWHRAKFKHVIEIRRPMRDILALPKVVADSIRMQRYTRARIQALDRQRAGEEGPTPTAPAAAAAGAPSQPVQSARSDASWVEGAEDVDADEAEDGVVNPEADALEDGAVEPDPTSGDDPVSKLPMSILQLSRTRPVDPPAQGRLGPDFVTHSHRFGASIHTIRLTAAELVRLPRDLLRSERFPILTELVLTHNKLRQLPASIGTLAGTLRRLDLTHNKLLALPPEIGKLRRLRDLQLPSNRLEELPKTIGKLRQLRRLNLDRNHLQDLPPTFSKLARLDYLNLSNNELERLPQALSKQPRLRVLLANNNMITVFAKLLCGLPMLEELQLSANDIVSLPDDIGQMARLRSLWLDWNHVTVLPLGFQDIAHTLVELRMQGCPLRLPPVEVLEQGGPPAAAEWLRARMDDGMDRRKRRIVNELMELLHASVKNKIVSPAVINSFVPIVLTPPMPLGRSGRRREMLRRRRQAKQRKKQLREAKHARRQARQKRQEERAAASVAGGPANGGAGESKAAPDKDDTDSSGGSHHSSDGSVGHGHKQQSADESESSSSESSASDGEEELKMSSSSSDMESADDSSSAGESDDGLGGVEAEMRRLEREMRRRERAAEKRREQLQEAKLREKLRLMSTTVPFFAVRGRLLFSYVIPAVNAYRIRQWERKTGMNWEEFRRAMELDRVMMAGDGNDEDDDEAAAIATKQAFLLEGYSSKNGRGDLSASVMRSFRMGQSRISRRSRGSFARSSVAGGSLLTARSGHSQGSRSRRQSRISRASSALKRGSIASSRRFSRSHSPQRKANQGDGAMSVAGSVVSFRPQSSAGRSPHRGSRLGRGRSSSNLHAGSPSRPDSGGLHIRATSPPGNPVMPALALSPLHGSPSIAMSDDEEEEGGPNLDLGVPDVFDYPPDEVMEAIRESFDGIGATSMVLPAVRFREAWSVEDEESVYKVMAAETVRKRQRNRERWRLGALATNKLGQGLGLKKSAVEGEEGADGAAEASGSKAPTIAGVLQAFQSAGAAGAAKRLTTAAAAAKQTAEAAAQSASSAAAAGAGPQEASGTAGVPEPAAAAAPTGAAAPSGGQDQPPVPRPGPIDTDPSGALTGPVAPMSPLARAASAASSVGDAADKTAAPAEAAAGGQKGAASSPARPASRGPAGPRNELELLSRRLRQRLLIPTLRHTFVVSPTPGLGDMAPALCVRMFLYTDQQITTLVGLRTEDAAVKMAAWKVKTRTKRYFKSDEGKKWTSDAIMKGLKEQDAGLQTVMRRIAMLRSRARALATLEKERLKTVKKRDKKVAEVKRKIERLQKDVKKLQARGRIIDTRSAERKSHQIELLQDYLRGGLEINVQLRELQRRTDTNMRMASVADGKHEEADQQAAEAFGEDMPDRASDNSRYAYDFLGRTVREVGEYAGMVHDLEESLAPKQHMEQELADEVLQDRVRRAERGVRYRFRLLRKVSANWRLLGIRGMLAKWKAAVEQIKRDRATAEKRDAVAEQVAGAAMEVTETLQAIERAKWVQVYDEWDDCYYWKHTETKELRDELPNDEELAFKARAAAEAADEDV